VPFVRRPTLVRRRAREHHVILHQHAVVEDRHARRTRHLASGIETRAMKDDVVRLPFARRTARVHERRVLAENRGRLTIGIRDVVVRVEHLDLIPSHQKYAAVAALLTLADGGERCHPLHVQLRVAKAVARRDAAGVRHHLDIAVLHLPRGG